MKKYSYYILTVLSIALLNSCGGESKSSEGNSPEQEDTALVEVTQDQFNSMNMEISTLKEREFDNMVKASGKIDVPPKNRAKVTSFIGGYVKSISLLVGNKASKGQPLLTLESPEYIDLQQSYLEIAGQMEYLKSEYERQKTLFDEKISSQKKYLEAESDYKRAKATYESLRQKLNMLRINPSQVEQGKFSSYITVYSPISGDITVINANVGMAISPVDVIMEIVETQAMHLELAVFEKDIFNLKNGQKIKFTVPQVGSDEFEAQVTQIGKSVGGNDRVINVYASLDTDTKRKLLTGMFVEAQLIADSRNAISVPFDAVTTEEGNNFLLVLESEKESIYTFRKTLVKTGERNGDWIEIIPDDKLDSDTKVLTKGVYDVI
ncbi:cobalt-zinc-cadmium efflux system membrane fusion protein [Dysgonomonas sp. PFB1-18]|uniref:efflux RND transporter periplasmic adaptor subunit n=1 Tax=unclassified Dysgonomonas TaxID=2630389 RepID=UPI002476409F|nr:MULTISPECIES: efflux RND transporter periplasmic adaptor subunit [unclassified Dysgonomonas]MDH6310138.1 cobalt-zinc-cadmium efflux system membrane fusion protein [Dysgonomonas sp. PF1-14]MDH6340196.1 cobalt-zinc-cadmium efflux system membrane fusion protein [Dysgonomonas sp. PF1-16]MDH6381695.1 cobalt-zinc-cadmium efflux system membrane fusion protein [Dysgonomonas sp. PFB1-18]MDH6399054.1 cobalt-zinc-cadmium efflux system membrane fusion protein [Dysgonomonas sp. PF1-23]